jgi:hypothetical protein
MPFLQENENTQKKKSSRKTKAKTDAGAKSDKIRIEHLNYKVVSVFMSEFEEATHIQSRDLT